MNPTPAFEPCPLVASALALDTTKNALAALVCPFQPGERLVLKGERNPRAPHLLLGATGQEISALAGVRRPGDRAPAWTDNPVIVFHVDGIDFTHPLDASPLSAETFAQRWILRGHIQDEHGQPQSSVGLLELSPATLRPRMERMPPMAKASEATRQEALDAYEKARSRWEDELDRWQPNAMPEAEQYPKRVLKR